MASTLGAGATTSRTTVTTTRTRAAAATAILKWQDPTLTGDKVRDLVRTEASEAVEAIKEDIMRTVKARLEIHTDSLVGENGEAKWQEQANVSSI